MSDWYFQRGVEHLDARRFRQAVRELTACIRAAGEDLPWAADRLGLAYVRSGAAAAAAEASLRRLLNDHAAVRDYAVGCLYRRLGRTAEAVPLFEAATSARPRLWAAAAELGQQRCRAGRDRDGLRLLRSAEKRFLAAGDLWGVAVAVMYLGVHSLIRFRLEEAEVLLRRAARLKQCCGDRQGLAAVRHNLGLVEYHRGDYAAAVDAFLAADEVWQWIGDAAFSGRTRNDLGVCYLDLGDLERAEEAFQHALEAFTHSGEESHQAAALNNLAALSQQRGRFSLTLRRYRQALTRLGPRGQPEEFHTARAGLAEALTRLGRPHESLAMMAAAPRPGRLAGPRARARQAIAIGRAHLALDKPEAAIRTARRALAEVRGAADARRVTLITEQLDAETLLGRSLLAAGRTAAARRTLSSAARKLDDLLATQRGAWIRIGLLERHREAHHSLVVAELRGRDGAQRAWEVAARLKAGQLRRNLQSRAQPAPSDGAGRRTATELEDRIAELVVAGPVGEREQRRLEALRRRYQTVADRLDSDTSVGLEAIAPCDVALRLSGEITLLEYHVSGETTIVFVHRAGQVEAFDLGLPQARLAGQVRRLLAPLERAGAAAELRPHLDAFDFNACHRLYRALVEPLLGRVTSGDDARLVVIPDGPLHQLPFELLCSESPGGAGSLASAAEVRYLCDDWTISYLPSSLLLGRRQRGRRQRPSSLTALGFSPAAGTRVVGPRGAVQAGSLPGARREAREVARLFDKASVLTGRDATADRFRRAAASSDVLHLAAHAICDVSMPGLGGVIVASEGDHARADLLTADRIARWQLGAELVTLSACETGRGRVRGAEGVLGLARAFLQAGSKAVLASLWSVEDQATRALMRSFYRSLREGRDRAAALAAAQRAMRDSGTDRAHPFFWAAFVLIDRQPSSPNG